jgi:predicted kinase
MRTIKTYSKRAPFYNAFIVTYVVELPTSRLLARNDFRVARDLGVVERTLPSQVRAAIFTVGLPRPRCTEDTGSGC